MSEGAKLSVVRALNVFRGYLADLAQDWRADGFLSADEIQDSFFQSAPLESLQKAAQAFGCPNLANSAQKFDKAALLSCIAANQSSPGEEPPVAGPVSEPTVSPPSDPNLLPAPFTNVIGREQLQPILDANRGKTVVLFVWSRNCVHCTLNKPAIIAAATQLSNKAAFVGIEFPFPLRRDEYGKLVPVDTALDYLKENILVSDGYKVRGFPTIVILKPDGAQQLVSPSRQLPLADALR